MELVAKSGFVGGPFVFVLTLGTDVEWPDAFVFEVGDSRGALVAINSSATPTAFTIEEDARRVTVAVPVANLAPLTPGREYGYALSAQYSGDDQKYLVGKDGSGSFLFENAFGGSC